MMKTAPKEPQETKCLGCQARDRIIKSLAENYDRIERENAELRRKLAEKKAA